MMAKTLKASQLHQVLNQAQPSLAHPQPGSVLRLLKSHSQWAAVESIYHRLSVHGYKAFLAGGCVRDALFGVQAHDLDIATDATPESIEKLFEKTVNVGKSFGVMRVLIEGADVEVATFRNDGEYQDGRRPEHVVFSTPEEDAQRRDFTVNALFYDLQRNEVLDFIEGQKDLQRKVLRTVGDPLRRFSEDHLRLLRGARFVAQLDFTLEEGTRRAMTSLAPLVKTVSGERIRDEIIKLLQCPRSEAGLEIMLETQLMKELFPWRTHVTDWNSYQARSVDIAGESSWQPLSLFFRICPEQELSQSLDHLHLSTKERQAILDAWNLWHKPSDFFKLRYGEQLQRLQKSGVRWALEILETEKSFQTEIAELFAAEAELGTALPKPFLGGNDVKGALQGESIGLCLREAYCLQLEKKLLSRDQALSWMKEFIEKLDK